MFYRQYLITYVSSQWKKNQKEGVQEEMIRFTYGKENLLHSSE